MMAYALGYRPRDDAEAFAAQIAETPAYPADATSAAGSPRRGFGIDEVASRS